MAASNLLDSILRNLEFLQDNRELSRYYIEQRNCFSKIKRELPFLKTFLLWSRMWRNKDVYVESYYLGEVDFPYFCSIIEDTLNRFGKQSFSKFKRSIQSFRKSIINVHKRLQIFAIAIQ
ncbi:hypothetical protein ACH5RR_018988 [Cinchona calisaya]|uniref:Uncharacterized protein n=1 Tax=Cinchona calisaya TaxID=153742 RepID=A0ABD2ZNE7_9GENT